MKVRRLEPGVVGFDKEKNAFYFTINYDGYPVRTYPARECRGAGDAKQAMREKVAYERRRHGLETGECDGE